MRSSAGCSRRFPPRSAARRGPRYSTGPRNAADRGRLLTVLNAFHQVPIPDLLWDDVGALLAALRSGGVTVPFADALIATVAVSAGLEFWTRDNQFQLIRAVEPRLLLFQEPP